jgi:hypothetical protein
MLDKLYPYRFKAFFFSQVSLLFSSLVVPATLHEAIVSPLLLLINLGAGILFTAKKRRVFWFLLSLLTVAVAVVGFSLLEDLDERTSDFVRMGTALVFYAIVGLEIIKQVWGAVSVNGNVILGLISGYLSLGLIGSFICNGIEITNPGSFRGLSADPNLLSIELNYYSYITLLTIGYGDIVPLTKLARTTSVLIGLMGQMYIVIITAVVVGKYINQNATEVRD